MASIKNDMNDTIVLCDLLVTGAWKPAKWFGTPYSYSEKKGRWVPCRTNGKRSPFRDVTFEKLSDTDVTEEEVVMKASLVFPSETGKTRCFASRPTGHTFPLNFLSVEDLPEMGWEEMCRR